MNSIETGQTTGTDEITTRQAGGEPTSSLSLLEQEAYAIRMTELNSMRCDISTRCDISVNAERSKRKLKQNPGIRITTDSERVARIVGTSKQRQWERAIGKAVLLIGSIHQEDPHAADNATIALFDDLRDPGRRDKAMQEIDTLYKSYTPEIREPMGVIETSEPSRNALPAETVVFKGFKINR